MEEIDSLSCHKGISYFCHVKRGWLLVMPKGIGCLLCHTGMIVIIVPSQNRLPVMRKDVVCLLCHKPETNCFSYCYAKRNWLLVMTNGAGCLSCQDGLTICHSKRDWLWDIYKMTSCFSLNQWHIELLMEPFISHTNLNRTTW